MNRGFRFTMAAVIVLALANLVLDVVAGLWSLIWIPFFLLALAGVLISIVRRQEQRRQ
jgi:hypothetical protein